MPHDTAAAPASIIRLLDSGEHLANGKYLLVASNLTHAAIEHRERPCHLQ